jgi:hypothetical protein
MECISKRNSKKKTKDKLKSNLSEEWINIFNQNLSEETSTSEMSSYCSSNRRFGRRNKTNLDTKLSQKKLNNSNSTKLLSEHKQKLTLFLKLEESLSKFDKCDKNKNVSKKDSLILDEKKNINKPIWTKRNTNNVNSYKVKDILNESKNIVDDNRKNKKVSFAKELLTLRKFPPKQPQLFESFYNFNNDNVQYDVKGNVVGKKVQNIFFGHTLNVIKNLKYNKVSTTQRINKKLLTIIYYRP